MAIIPVAQKFHTVSSSVDTADKGSSLFQSDREIYTMQDIINTVSATGGSIDGSGAQYALPVFTDTNTLTNLPLGNAGQTLISGGAAADPSWGVEMREATGSFYGKNLYIGNSLSATDFGGNIIIGENAGTAVTNLVYLTTIIGRTAGEALTATENSVLIGYGNSSTITTMGAKNVSVGGFAGSSTTNTVGDYNVSVGYQASPGTGADAIIIGGQAGKSGGNGSQSGSVMIGKRAGYGGGAGDNTYSVFIGNSAGNAKTSGTNCIIIGNGADASTTTVDNEITLGNSSIATIRAQVTTITALSDERDKKDIVDLDHGLDMVNQLKPRKFVWDHRAEKRVVTETTTDSDGKTIEVDKEEEFYSARKGSKDVGFIAQELQTVDNEWMQLVNDSNPDKLEASYGKLVPVLVKAIQELSAKVTALENA